MMISSWQSPLPQALLRVSAGDQSKISKITIVACDPGLIAGIAVLWGGDFYAVELPHHSALIHIQFLVDKPGLKKILVSERYMPTGKVMTPQLDAMEMNGAQRFIAAQHNTQFQLQSRSEAKKIASDSVLKSLGWYDKTKDGHANDAARHLCLAMLTYYPVEWLTLLDSVD